MSIFTGAGVAIVTPFNEDESINYDKLDQLIDYHCNNGTDSIIICGTTGESATMSEKEHMECVKFAIERTKGRLPIIAGTGSNCTRTAIDMSKEAASYGADGLLVVTPYYNKATQEGLVGHYTAVAKEAKAPIIMYSVASRTGCNIEPATAARLIKEVVISVLSNVAPQETHDICAKFFEGDVKGSLELQLKAIPLIEQLFCEVNPIPVKKAMKLMGMDCGSLRMPLTELTPQHEESLAKAMTEFGIKLA